MSSNPATSTAAVFLRHSVCPRPRRSRNCCTKSTRTLPWCAHLPHSPPNAPQLFADVDVLVEAFDVPDAKGPLVAGFDRPFPTTLVSSGLAGYGSGNTVRVHRLGKRSTCRRPRHRGASGAGADGPRVGVAAHLQANMVLRLLLGEEEE